MTTERDQLKGQVSSLSGQVSSLSGQLSTLTSQVATLTQERDSARSQLASAQSGVAGAITTMAPVDIWNNLLPPIRSKFNSPRWQSSYYSSGDYRSYDFTYCGFC